MAPFRNVRELDILIAEMGYEMSLLFGCANLQESSAPNQIPPKAVIDDFSLNGRRHLLRQSSGNLHVYHASPRSCALPRAAESSDKSMVLILGGWICDYDRQRDELKHCGYQPVDLGTSTQVLLCSFQEWGTACFKDINGIFCCVILDKKRNRLVLANDTFGLYPVFIHVVEGELVFCSEYQVIMRLGTFRNDLNHEAVAEYFLLGTTLGDKTFFQNISRLTPGAVVTWENGRITTNSYDAIDTETLSDQPRRVVVEKLYERFRLGVQARLREFKVRRADLTGGLDTRLVLGCLTSEQRMQFESQTGVSPFLSEAEDKDVIAAKKLTREFGLHHRIRTYPVPDEFGPQFFDERRIPPDDSHFRFVGTCGGELLGFSCQDCFAHLECSSKPFDAIREFVASQFSRRFMDKVGQLADLKCFLEVTRAQVPPSNRFMRTAIDVLNRAFFSSIYGGAFSGWLCRHHDFLEYQLYPFLDKNFLMELLKVPIGYRQEYVLYLEIMRTFHPEMLRLPFASSGCDDMRLTRVTEGRSHFQMKRWRYGEVARGYIERASSWTRRSFSASYLERTETRMRDFIEHEDVLGASIVRACDFEGWIRKYYLPELNE